MSAVGSIKKPLRVGVLGATGAVGREMVDVLRRREVPVSDVRLLASGRSAGREIGTPFGPKTVEEFSIARAADLDVVLMAVSGDFAKAHAKEIAAAGPVVIDNSSAFRYDPDIPLVVPQINAAAIGNAKLIANPNCTTAIALMALAPLHAVFGLKRVIVSTYQATSGAGAEGMAELEEQTMNLLTGKPVEAKVFRHPIPFNVIPHIDVFLENGYTREEMKVTWETRKIMGLPDLPVSCTAVRIPIHRAHSEAITIETERPVSVARAREAIARFPGAKLVDDPANAIYPMPLNASGQFDVEVGRIRANPIFGEFGLDVFVSGDQLLRGAALNAVEIAEAVFSA